MPRDKTGKGYEVLSCRVPSGLTARLSAYAGLHSQRVRDVVAAAVLAYLEGTHVAPLDTPAAHVVRQAQQRLTDVVKLLESVQALEQPLDELGSVQAPSVIGNTGITFVDGDIPVARMEAQSSLVQAPVEDETWVEIPPYDRAKHHLGKLCKRGHAWGKTDQSLKNAGNQCLECRALAKREKDTRKRAEREAQPVSG